MNNFWHHLPANFLALAPMAGVTDIAFRDICRQQGADLIYTEFVSTDALIHNNPKTKQILAFNDTTRPVIGQLFGHDPQKFYQAAQIMSLLGLDGIDLNFGCPAYKVVKTGGGVALMRNLKLCHQIIEATIKGSKLPVSIKIRASIQAKTTTKEKKFDQSFKFNQTNPEQTIKSDRKPNLITALDLVHQIKELPLSAIMIHARSYETPFDGQANWPLVSQIREIWPGILIANGGITTPEIAKQVLETTKVDGLGLARGLWGKPWLSQQIKDYLKTGHYQQPSLPEIKKIIKQHATLALKYKGEHGLIELRKHLAKYVNKQPQAKFLRQQLVQVSTLPELDQVLNQWTETSATKN